MPLYFKAKENEKVLVILYLAHSYWNIFFKLIFTLDMNMHPRFRKSFDLWSCILKKKGDERYDNCGFSWCSLLQSLTSLSIWLERSLWPSASCRACRWWDLIPYFGLKTLIAEQEWKSRRQEYTLYAQCNSFGKVCASSGWCRAWNIIFTGSQLCTKSFSWGMWTWTVFHGCPFRVCHLFFQRRSVTI